MASLLRSVRLIAGPRAMTQNKSILVNHVGQTIKRSLCLRTTGPVILCRQSLKAYQNQNVFLVARLSRFDYRDHRKNKSTMMVVVSVVVMVLGMSYAAVPLYRIYCQKTKTGGQAVVDDDINQKVASMKKVKDRTITVRFDAERSSRLAWDFRPSQTEINCSPGETVLAFYTAKNQLDHPVNGIATYTLLPYEAGKYFNKIQCFCFEEQQLNPNEEVDLPVFFYIDPEFNLDPVLFDVKEIVLCYNFFETKDGFKLPKQPPVRAHLPMKLVQPISG